MNRLVKRLRRRDEEGSALVLALFFTFIFSLLVTAVITFADTGLKSSKSYRAKRTAAIGPEAAMETAIQRRLTGGACDDSTHSPLDTSDQPVGGTDLVVRCQNLVSTSTDPATGSPNTPRTALLALGADGAEGIVNGSNLRVRGDVFSRSQIDGGPGLVVEGRVSASGACPAVSTDTNPSTTASCGGAPPYDPVEGRDPDFTRSTTAVPVHRAVPACSDGVGEDKWLVTLLPGYYDDASTATGLSRLTSGGACAGKVVWLQPGTYYFDFGHLGGPSTWTVTDPTVHVVGGQAKGWSSELLPDRTVTDGATTDGDPTVTSATAAFTAADVGRSISGGSLPAGSRVASVTDAQTVEVTLTPTADATGVTLTVADPRPDPDLSVPGSCLGTGDDGYDDGVEVIVGGESRVDVADGRMELCAPPRASEQQVALYGIGPERAVHTLEPTSVTAVDGFTDPHRAFVPGELANATSDAELTAAGPATSASLSVGSFRQSIPANAVVDSAVLRVAHSETGDVGTVRVTPTGCSGGPQTLTTNPTMAEDTVDLSGPACGIDDPSGFDGLSVLYEVTFLGGGTVAVNARLDAIVIDVAYRVPTTRKPTGATASGFTNEAAAREIGERPAAYAGANLSVGTPTASVALSGFADPPVPAGATIEAAVLRVAHAELGPDPVEASVTADFPSSTCTGAQVLGSSTSFIEETLDLVADCGLSDPSELVELTATYTAALTTGGTAGVRLDGLWFDLVFSQGRDPDSAVSAGGSFGSEASGDEIDGNLATANLSPGPGATASITVGGAWDTPAIPADAIVDTARLRIRHRDDGDIAADGVTVTPSITGGSTCTGVPLTPRREKLVDDFLDLKACGLDQPGDLANLSVQYDVALAGGGTSATDILDGMELLLSYRPHTTRLPTAVDTANGFDGPTADGLEIDGDTTDAALADPGTTSASITVSGFGAPALPADAVVDSAVLRVRHQEDAGVEATLTPLGCSGGAQDLTELASLGDEEVDLVTDCSIDTVAEINALTATFAVALTAPTPAGTGRLDGMVLEVVFRPPAFVPLAGCHSTLPYPSAVGSCALVRTVPGTTSRFVVNGTIYAPSAALDLAMADLDGAVVTRGAIARTIHLDVGSLSSRPVIGVPPESVLFTVYPALTHQADSAASTDFGDPDRAKAVGEPTDPTTTFTLTAGGPLSASLTLSDFHLPEIGPGTRFDGAVLRVLHAEDPVTGDPVTLEVDVDFTGESGPCANPFPVTPNLGPAVAEDRVDISPCGFDDPADLAGLTVTFRATIPDNPANDATVALDGIVLELFAGPRLRAQVTFQGGRANVEGWSVLS